MPVSVYVGACEFYIVVLECVYVGTCECVYVGPSECVYGGV